MSPNLTKIAALALVVIFFPSLLFAQDTAARLQQVKAAMESNRFDEAIRVAGQVISAEPKNEEVLTLRARSYIIQGKVAEASADADAVLAMNPRNPFALNVRGMVKGANKDYKGAFDELTKAVTIDPTFYRSYYQRSRVRISTGENLSAILGDLDLAIRHSNEEGTMLRAAGDTCLEKRGRAETCSAYFTRYKAKYPDSPIGYLGYALSYVNNFGSVADKSVFESKVIADLRRAIELDPKGAIAPMEAGRLYMHLKKYQEAMGYLDKAALNDPKRPLIFGLRGDANFTLDRLDAAIADYSRAIELDPNYQLSYRWRAKARDKKGERLPIGYKSDADKTYWEETFNDFKKAAELAGQDYVSYSELDKFVSSLARFAASQQKDPSLEKRIEGQKDAFYRSLIEANPKNVCARYFLLESSGYFENREAWDSLINNYDGKNGSKCAGDAALWIGRVHAEGARYRGIAANPVKAQEYYDMVLKFDPQNAYVQRWIAQLPKELKGTPMDGPGAVDERQIDRLRASINRGLDAEKRNELDEGDAQDLAEEMVAFGKLLKAALSDPALNQLYRIGYAADMTENNKQLKYIIQRYGLREQ